MSRVIRTIRYHNELVVAYIVSMITAVSTSAYYGLFPIDIDTVTGVMKTFMIGGVFFIPFIITAIISSEMRSRNSLTDYMQAWADISMFWILFLGLTQTILSKSPNFFAMLS
ncbi:MAG: hypothetical protein AB1763_09320 [Campylobacterota bacterium]